MSKAQQKKVWFTVHASC